VIKHVEVEFWRANIDPLCRYITAELVPQEARSLALSIAQFINNSGSLVLGFALLPAFQVS
jgi:hypothetical protein